MLKKHKQEFLDGKTNKWQYIDKMYEDHKLLLEYSEFMCGTNISQIEITDNKLVMTFRDSGIKMYVGKNDARLVPLETLNFGSYENDELLMQQKLIGTNDNVFDIGANYGWFSLHIAKKYPSAKVYAFEPIPFTHRFLSENVKLNALGNIFLNEFGMSDKEGAFDFYYDETSSGNASMENVADKKNIQVLKCKVQTLDHFVSEKNVPVNYIKCDIEGAELFAFKGGVNTIKKYHPIIFAEMLRKWSAKFNYHPNEIIKLLSSLKYSCFSLAKDRLQPLSEITEETVETNFFFLHKEKHNELIKKYS
ncbi:MAG TPA: FkbM family methyltransferase [Bacteroidia bacterium]